MNAGIAQTGAKIILFDHILADYGPETKDVREQLRHTVASVIERIWPEKKGGVGGLRALESVDAAKTIRAKLREFTPKNDLQKSILAQASQVSSDILQARLLLMEGQQNTLPTSFLALLIFWLTGLFISFGLFAPRNGTVLAVLLICALSVSSAIFLVLEMDRPLRWIHQGVQCSAAQSCGAYWQVKYPEGCREAPPERIGLRSYRQEIARPAKISLPTTKTERTTL